MRDNFGNELDEIKFRDSVLVKNIDGNTYKIHADKGKLFGYANVENGVCKSWETYALQFTWDIKILYKGEFKPLSKRNEKHQKQIDEMSKDFCEYIEKECINKKWEAA